MAILPRAVAVEKSQEEGKPVFEFDPKNRVSKAFLQLAERVIKNVR